MILVRSLKPHGWWFSLCVSCHKCGDCRRGYPATLVVIVVMGFRPLWWWLSSWVSGHIGGDCRRVSHATRVVILVLCLMPYRWWLWKGLRTRGIWLMSLCGRHLQLFHIHAYYKLLVARRHARALNFQVSMYAYYILHIMCIRWLTPRGQILQVLACCELLPLIAWWIGAGVWFSGERFCSFASFVSV